MGKNFDNFSVVVISEKKRTTVPFPELNLFHVEGFVVGEKYSAVTGFLQGRR
jgi:hypothetical protein